MPLIIPGQENSPIVKLDLANLGSNQFLKVCRLFKVNNGLIIL